MGRWGGKEAGCGWWGGGWRVGACPAISVCTIGGLLAVGLAWAWGGVIRWRFVGASLFKVCWHSTTFLFAYWLGLLKDALAFCYFV